MKLSEAIRLGSLLRPQSFWRLWDGKTSCALGAAYEAAGLLPKLPDEHALYAIFPLLRLRRRCPDCSYLDRVKNVVTHLNDQHKFTREQIAEWVTTVEPEEPPQPQENFGRSPCEFFDLFFR